MGLVDFLLLLAIAGICGSLGQAIVGYGRGGFLAAIALGFIGALLGTFLARSLGLPTLLVVKAGGASLPIVWSIVGSALLVVVLGLLHRGRR